VNGHDLVECIVALPGQLFYATRVPATLWFLNRDKSSDGSGNRRDHRNETLFIDARKLGVIARADASASHDRDIRKADNFGLLVRNVYKVLLTRGTTRLRDPLGGP
jgi:type I restriction-modification system DNA methylase subunit